MMRAFHVKIFGRIGGSPTQIFADGGTPSLPAKRTRILAKKAADFKEIFDLTGKPKSKGGRARASDTQQPGGPALK
jgi:hypothetical protein